MFVCDDDNNLTHFVHLLPTVISKSGTHMEHSLISACVCLLFGCCIQDNTDYRTRIEQALPNGSFDPLIEMLEKLRDFAHLAVSTTTFALLCFLCSRPCFR